MRFSRGPRSETPVSEGSGKASVLWTLGLFLFYGTVAALNLGAPALFDPDEGRNAEIAREILLLNDWVTPHYNFTSRLDKPILFYSLIAGSFKAFGLSEWAARLPSAVSALATLAVVYLFSTRFLGPWQARWTTLIMLTSAGFLAMSGIAIFDMTLTLFVTTALLSFYWIQSAPRSMTEKKIACVIFYAALGAAALVKGVIGLAVPGMVVFCYLLCTAQWSLVRRMELPLGICLLLLIVLPWYLWAEFRNPGYLHYFIVEEHLLRFISSQFGRTQPWHYYLLVLALGFSPWTLILPLVVVGVRGRLRSHTTLFFVLWIAVPFVFFSLSSSKHPHYLLPILPPLSMMTGTEIVARLSGSRKRQWPLSLPAFTMIVLTLASLAVIGLYSDRLPQDVGAELRAALPRARAAFLVGLPVALVLSATVIRMRLWRIQTVLFLMTAVAFFLFYLGNLPVKTVMSRFRSAKELAHLSAPLIPPGARLAVYNTYIAGLPFYLRLEHPLIVVWSGNDHSLMSSRYAARGLSRPAPDYPESILTFEEFEESLDRSGRELFVFVQPKHVGRLTKGRARRFEKVLETKKQVLLKYDPRRSAARW